MNRGLRGQIRRFGGQAAIACGYRAAMRTCARMSEKRADAVCSFGREDVLKPAGLFCHFFLVVHMESLCEQPLSKAVTADHVLSALASFFREDNHLLTVVGVVARWTKSNMAAV